MFMTLGPHTVAALVVAGLTGIFFILVTIYLSLFPSVCLHTYLPIYLLTYLSTYARHSEVIWAVASVLANKQL